MDKLPDDHLSTYNYVRATLYNPIKKRNEFKVFNTSKHANLEECKQKAKEWKEMKKKEFTEIIEKMDKEVSKKVKVEDFKIDLIDGLSICMIGSTRSGKSTCLNYLMDNYFFKPDNKYINCIFSNSYQAPVYDNFKKNKSTVGSIIYQDNIIKEMYKINTQTKNKYNFNVILDDIVNEKHNEQLKKLLTIYRNSRIGCIIALQNVKLISPTCRSNINYVLLFKMNNDEAIEQNIKAFLLSFFPRSYKMVDKIKKYRELTENHQFFLINNLEGSISLCKVKV